jgi:hypothetical protein
MIILLSVYNLILLQMSWAFAISFVFIYEISKNVRSKEDRLYNILLSAQEVSLITSLAFETIAVIIMLLVKDDYVFRHC